MMTHLPPPITGNSPDSFAHFTIVTRLPHILDKIIEDNPYSQEIVDELQALKSEIPDQPVHHTVSLHPSEAAYWDHYLAQYAGKNWLEAPFYFVEAYFYRRILQVVRFFDTGKWFHHDPFQQQKQAGLAENISFIRQALDRQENLIEQQAKVRENLRSLLLMNLWGNRADMSLLPGQQKSLRAESHSDDSLVIDDFEALWHYMHQHAPDRVDFILDNAGVELAGDLLLADFLLSTSLAQQIVFHAKSYPTFVSDATREDVDITVRFFSDPLHFQTRVGKRIEDYVQQSRLLVTDHLFWNSPAHFFEMPKELQYTLAGADLVISKGDANYRRLLGDAQWEFTTPIDAIVDYLPAPCLALRALKSEIIVGMTAQRLEKIDTSDHQWLTSGKYGLMQFILNDRTSE